MTLINSKPRNWYPFILWFLAVISLMMLENICVLMMKCDFLNRLSINYRYKEMSKLIVVVCTILLLPCLAQAGSVRIYNSDSKTHVVKLKCNGSSKILQVNGSATSTYTFHSTASQCEIVGGSVDFSVSSIKDGQKWTFRSGLASQG